MKIYVMDVFTDTVCGGNQAGVAIDCTGLHREQMQKIAADLAYSETVFVTENSDGSVTLRFFTPTSEVPLCGHGTIGAFFLLRRLNRIGCGTYTACTQAGTLQIQVEDPFVWMDMAKPRVEKILDASQWAPLYEAFGLTAEQCPAGFVPQILYAGLADILLPVKNHRALMEARQNEEAVTELSRAYQVTGIHMFCPGDCTYAAYCSNFAPGCGIPEECATGTSNGALTYYLYLQGLITEGKVNAFLQGEHMNRPSVVYSRLKKDGAGGVKVQIGGQAVMRVQQETGE